MQKTENLNFFAQLKHDLQPSILLPSLTSGIINGILLVIIAISFGALIFSGDLVEFLPRGVGLALFSVLVISTITAIWSSFVGVVSSVQDTSSAILALAAADIATEFAGEMGPEEMLITVIATIAGATILTGVAFFLLGKFKLGGLVRYVPYPVIGGFLAGTGWLLLGGSLGVLTGVSLSPETLFQFVQPEILLLWVPGVVFGVLLLVMVRRFSHYLILPGMILGGIGSFYIVLLVSGMSFAEAETARLVVGNFPEGSGWSPLTLSELSVVNWLEVLHEGHHVASMLAISLMALLLNISGIALASEEDIDLNQELQVAGFANIIAGLGGGIVGFQSISLSMLGRRLGAKSRLSGLFAAAVCAVAFFLGTSLLTYFPTFVLGGLLFFLGLAFMADWVLDAWSTLPRWDYAVMILIVVVIATTDFITGVAVGLVAMIVLFIVNYSRVDVVRNQLSGKDYHSSVARIATHRDALHDAGESILIFKLQGFIFFGTAAQLSQHVENRIADGVLPVLKFSVIDFGQVTGIDSSAILSIKKSLQQTAQYDVKVVFSGLSKAMIRQLEEGGIETSDDLLISSESMDRGMEWCEEQMLEILDPPTPSTIEEQLLDNFPNKRILDIVPYLEEVIFKAGDTLIMEGDTSDMMYFIESGTVVMVVKGKNKKSVFIGKRSSGTVTGEMSLYRKRERTATVLAETETHAYALTREAFDQMRADDPELGRVFDEFIILSYMDRLVHTNHTKDELLK